MCQIFWYPPAGCIRSASLKLLVMFCVVVGVSQREIWNVI